MFNVASHVADFRPSITIFATPDWDTGLPQVGAGRGHSFVAWDLIRKKRPINLRRAILAIEREPRRFSSMQNS